MNNQLFKKIVLYLIIISVLALVGLTILVHYHPVLSFDIRASIKLQSEGDTFIERYILVHFLTFISFIGQTTVAFSIVILIAALFWFYDYHWEALFSLIAASSAVFNSIFKYIIGRPRPSASIVSILDKQLSPSYPSGHVVFFSVFFGFLIAAMFYAKGLNYYLRIITVIVSVVLIVLVSISRVFLGAHWVTDVIAGYLFGLIFLLVLLFFYQRKYQAGRYQPKASAKS